jgi:hypothetical protein
MITEANLTISGLRARAVNVELERPVQTSGGEIPTAPLVLIDLQTEDGTTGHAYVFSYTPLALEPLRIHAGGIVWIGPWLHIAATSRGFVTARVDDTIAVEGDNERPAELGVHDGRVHSYGPHYVLPVRFRYRAHSDDPDARLRHSFMSLARGSRPPTLVCGEYGRSGQSTRLAHYEIDPGSGMLVTGEDGFSRPSGLDAGGVRQMQGVAVVDGTHYVSVSQGPWVPGSVFTGVPGRLRRHRWAMPMGPEDLTYWPSTDSFWSVSEHPRRRWIFEMPRRAFD